MKVEFITVKLSRKILLWGWNEENRFDRCWNALNIYSDFGRKYHAVFVKTIEY